MSKIVEREPFQSLIELFHECFPQWKVKSWYCKEANEIFVELDTGASYLFGTNETDNIYLNRVESQKTQVP